MQAVAYKASRIVAFANELPARGNALFCPVEIIDNGMIIARDGTIEAIGANLAYSGKVLDLGDVTVLPGLVNAHSHLQLSWLKNRTLWRKGFGAWLASMIPHILDAVKSGYGMAQKTALTEACSQLAATGTRFIADTGGSLPTALEAVHAACQQAALPGPRFCEWFGYGQSNSVWPDRCEAAIKASPQLHSICAPAGHALYSTDPVTMQKASAWCKRNGRIFSFHLAESPEETELLGSGRGALKDLYQENVLPENWQPPGLSPLAYALKLGLLSPHTLAVHATQLNNQEIEQFAGSGASICLCPRSNSNLATGVARIHDMISAGVLLCLGTDGLSSCEDLDLRNEAYFLHKNRDIPMQALWRMATINGAHALKLGKTAGKLLPGSPARFSIWPDVDGPSI